MKDPSDFLLLILSSPSGAGKTTLTKRLLARFPDFRFSVSHTTRPPRANEVNGQDYHFTTRGEFEKLVAADAFVEWADVHGNLYGTARGEIERAKGAVECDGLLFDIDYQGARQIRAKLPEVVGVFVLPPSLSELEKRLRGRASDSEEVVQRRFRAAKLEIEHYALFDYVLLNDHLDHAFTRLEGIILAERSKRLRKAHQAEQLLRAGRVL